jgi:hypothetical protein
MHYKDLDRLPESETVEFKRELPSQREQIAIGATAVVRQKSGRL